MKLHPRGVLELSASWALGGILTCLLCLIFSKTLSPAQASVVPWSSGPRALVGDNKTWDEAP